MNIKHILLIEVLLRGHRIVWLENITSIFLKDGNCVTIAILKDFDRLANSIFDYLKHKFPDKLKIVTYDHPRYNSWPLFSNLQNDYYLRQSFGKIYRRVNSDKLVDYVFLPSVDYCFNSLSLFGSPFGKSSFGGISHNINIGQMKNINYPPKKTKFVLVKLFLYLSLLRNKNLKYLLTQDELLYQFIYKNYQLAAKKLVYMPDPIDLNCDQFQSKDIARKHLKISSGVILILVYGDITDRKGLDKLISALTIHKSEIFQVLIVGPQQLDEGRESVMNTVKSSEFNNLLKAKRLHVINKFVDNNVQQQVFAASDIVWLGYKNFFMSSSVMSLAANTDNLILASREGLIGYYVTNKKLGEVFNVNNIDEVIAALTKLSSFSSIEHYKRKADFAHFKEFTWKNAEGEILKFSQLE